MTRPGGVIRIFEIIRNTLHQAGHLFSLDNNGVSSELPVLLDRYGLQNVQTSPHVIEYRGGTEEGRLFYEDMRHAFRTAMPFYQKWGELPQDYEEICQQALSEMQQLDFVATWRLFTVWGKTP